MGHPHPDSKTVTPQREGLLHVKIHALSAKTLKALVMVVSEPDAAKFMSEWASVYLQLITK